MNEATSAPSSPLVLQLLALVISALGAHAVRAQACEEPPSRAVDAGGSAGRPQLAQGISLYEAKNLVMAERALQAALFTGLADRGEQASAHKYLAYIYCSRQEWARCEASFDAAFATRPTFALQPFELQGTPWRDSYAKAQGRAAQRCPALQSARAITQPNPSGGFALNSSVIASASPLMAGAMPMTTTAPDRRAAPLPPGHNLRIKARPWAQVYVDGRQVGVSPPLVSLQLTPGQHTVELRNPGFESHKQQVQASDGPPTTITHDFDAQ